MMQIRVFITAARTLNFTEAANRLYLSQPVVSKWIAKLENTLGAKLFVRGKYGVTLTRTGSLLYANWEKLYADFESSLTAAGIGKAESGVLRIGTLMTVRYHSMVVKAIADFAKRFPQITLVQESYEYRDLRENLLSGKLDAAFTYSYDVTDSGGETPQKGFDYKKLKQCDILLAYNTDDHRGRNPKEGLRQFEKETFFFMSPAESYRCYEESMKVCRAAGFVPERIRLVSNVPSMELAVQQGRGVALCDWFMARVGEPVGVVPLDRSLGCNHLAAVWRKDDPSPILAEFLKLLPAEN